jgi:hypothetical protein
MPEATIIEWLIAVPLVLLSIFMLYRAFRRPNAALYWPALFVLILWLFAFQFYRSEYEAGRREDTGGVARTYDAFD